jgi:hypothetical protein
METSDLCLQQHLIMDRGSMPGGGRQARGNVGAVGRNDSAGWKGRLAAGCGNLLGAPPTLAGSRRAPRARVEAWAFVLLKPILHRLVFRSFREP